MCARAALQRLFGKKGGVNAAIYHPGAALASHSSHLISAQSVAGMDADSDNIAGLNGIWINLFERFIHQDGIACGSRRGGRKYKEPPGRNNRRSKRIVAWIDQMDARFARALLFLGLSLGPCNRGDLYYEPIEANHVAQNLNGPR